MSEGAATPLPAKVTVATAPAVIETLSAGLAAGSRAFDLAGCTEFDSALIAVLLELDRQARRAGGSPLRVLNPPPNLRKLAALYGVDGILLDERN